ncbi:MAG: MBL fold metallo-hydrolase [Deltaproteobacteria bacterium]|nr:MBL fold metallo-hydrolase [Deltaproteobacteria bacterium]
MKVTDHVHAIKIPFAVPTRFVYLYFIYGKKICLVDSGIASAKEKIFGYLRETGRDPQEIQLLVQTHSHADHIGLSAEFKKISGCKVAAHVAEKNWIEDIEEQYRKRPTPTFRSYVQDSTKIDLVVKDGDVLDLGGGENLKVIHTPGHSTGSISFVYPTDGALFSGDAIPLAGGLPIYADVFVTIQSLKKLRAVKGLQALFSSWHDPVQGEKVYQTMDEALAYMQKVHGVVRQENAGAPSLDSQALTIRVLKVLGIPENLASPIVVTTIEAHRQAGQHPDILTV